MPGSNPPETALAEVYEPPFDNPKAPVHGYSPRGMDVDRNGVVWAALASGHLASFDRRKCKGPLNGPNGDRPALPRGLDALSRAAAAVEGRDRVGQRRSELLHLGRSVRHARPRREHADRHRQRVRRAARAEGRQVGRAARAVSDRASTRNGWTAASTIRRPAGRAAASGRPSARARRSTWRRARARTSKVISSSCGPIRWRSSICRVIGDMTDLHASGIRAGAWPARSRLARGGNAGLRVGTAGSLTDVPGIKRRTFHRHAPPDRLHGDPLRQGGGGRRRFRRLGAR